MGASYVEVCGECVSLLSFDTFVGVGTGGFGYDNEYSDIFSDIVVGASMSKVSRGL
jgi:hypothetical protein